MLRQRLATSVFLALAILGTAWPALLAQKMARESAADAAAFLRNVKQLCGKRFAGKGVFTATPEDPMAKAALVMHVASCREREVRIPFLVGEDRSRTWVLTLKEDGLLFKHDHRHDEHTPDEVTNYG